MKASEAKALMLKSLPPLHERMGPIKESIESAAKSGQSEIGWPELNIDEMEALIDDGYIVYLSADSSCHLILWA